jgi:transcriptional regulator with XRE-family HTH domain
MVYFLRLENLVKIGYTNKLNTRINALKSQFKGASLIKCVTGTVADEKFLHKKFEHIRQNGEWFKNTKELASYINSLKSCKNTSVYNDLEIKLGASVKAQRLLKNLTREALCAKAGVSMNGLRHLEGGQGTSVNTLVKIAEALGKSDWVLGFSPTVSINPLNMVRGKIRQRGSRHNSKKAMKNETFMGNPRKSE